MTEDENYPEYISETMKNKDDAKSRVTKGSEGGEDEEKAETLETKLRKTRPPASVRILNSIPQPDFVSIRLENVAVTFKNQEVGLSIVLSRMEYYSSCNPQWCSHPVLL